MSANATPHAARPDVNIVVCTDEYGCGRWHHRGRNADAVLSELREAVAGVRDGRVQVTTAGCIMGCTYGPRFDVARRWSGEKALYGSIAGAATVTRRGQVSFAPIPDDLAQVIEDHLPESAAPLAALHTPTQPADVGLLRSVLLDCSAGMGDIPIGLGEAVVMVHNAAATVSIPATLDDLEFVDGSGNPDQHGGIAVLATDGDGRVACNSAEFGVWSSCTATWATECPATPSGWGMTNWKRSIAFTCAAPKTPPPIQCGTNFFWR